ncbi:unnamed protein product [Danaus chrysippus]|nr:unnamed protein product [Danaus chrysippus]
MRPNTEKPPTCEASKMPPLLHLTPSTTTQRGDFSPVQGVDNPCLLKPQHDIPPTPPPQTDSKPNNFFPQKIG